MADQFANGAADIDHASSGKTGVSLATPVLFPATATKKPSSSSGLIYPEPISQSVSQSPAKAEVDGLTDKIDLVTPEQIQTLLLETLASQLPGEVPGIALCKRIVKKLQGAPPDLLRKRILRRINRMASMGMAENFAGEVGEAYRLAPQSGTKPAEESYDERWYRKEMERRAKAKSGAAGA